MLDFLWDQLLGLWMNVLKKYSLIKIDKILLRKFRVYSCHDPY